MSPSPAEPALPAPDTVAPTGEALLRLLREELIKTQLIVLELNDRVLAKETEKADAVAILGRVELVLEQKINYISDLDRALNEQIAKLRQQVDAAQTECGARDDIIKDLAGRLEAANQEVTRMHGVAGGYARDLAHTREALAAESTHHQHTQTTLASTESRLAEQTSKLAETNVVLAATKNELAATQARLDETSQALTRTESTLADERRRLASIFASLLWRWGRPWRAMFGPKV